MGKTLQKLLSSDETVRLELKRLEHRVKDSTREEELQRENRQRFSLKRVEALSDRKNLAEKRSQILEKVSQTKKRLKE